MHKPSLVAGAAGLVIVTLVIVVWWRQSELTDELSALRAQLAASSREPAISPAQREIAAAPEAAAPSPRENTPADDRIADLERVANAQADVIEDLLARLDGMEMTNRRSAAPAWSALQAIGGPDSSAGDQRTAWAPATQDGGAEWLEVDFPNAVEVGTVIVRENCAPGAIVRISAVTDAGNEVPLWQGDAPKVPAVSDTPFPAAPGILANRVKIYLDTQKVPGWNEIDAVQLVGRDGSRQWASGARASSTYGAGSNIQLGQTITDSGGLSFEGFVNYQPTVPSSSLAESSLRIEKPQPAATQAK
jgi:hypothetical protein